jgi:predicted regulator of Ras-like GTPase activity (Roadblock/LC7/MglB family)
MKAILDDLKDIPGVTGVFVCNGEGKVLASSLEAPIAPDLLDRVARVLGRTAAGVHTIKGKGTLDLEMVYESGVLVLKPLEPGCLCIFCVAKVNVPMLNLTANMAVRQLKKAIAGGAAAAAAVPVAGGAKIPTGAVTQIEHELAVAVGPVAMLVVDETLAKLRCTRETLTEAQTPAFLDGVAAEIPDAAKKARFLESAKRILAH